MEENWLPDGMSLGSAAAFMITGPATKLTNLGAVRAMVVTGLYEIKPRAPYTAADLDWMNKKSRSS